MRDGQPVAFSQGLGALDLLFSVVVTEFPQRFTEVEDNCGAVLVCCESLVVLVYVGRSLELGNTCDSGSGDEEARAVSKWSFLGTLMLYVWPIICIGH